MKYLLSLLAVGVLFLLSLTVSASSSHSASLFFSSPDFLTAALNFKGDKVVALRIVNENQRLILINVEKNTESILLDLEGYSKKESMISRLAWINDQYIAVQLSELKNGIEDLLDTQIARRVLILDTTKSVGDPSPGSKCEN